MIFFLLAHRFIVSGKVNFVVVRERPDSQDAGVPVKRPSGQIQFAERRKLSRRVPSDSAVVVYEAYSIANIVANRTET